MEDDDTPVTSSHDSGSHAGDSEGSTAVEPEWEGTVEDQMDVGLREADPARFERKDDSGS